MLSAAGQAGCRIGGETFLWVRAEESAMRQAQKTMAAPKRTTKAESEEGIARFLAALDAHTKLLAFFFGLCFVAALLVLAVWFPQPTPFQYTVFRIVLALAAAGVAGVIPGMISLKAQPGTVLLIHAGGALAVFVMVYLLAPAALKLEEKPVPPSQPQKEEKPVPAAQPLKISGVDAIENGMHILDFTPPLTRHTVRLSNIGEASVHISLIGFPEKYFYTNLADEKSLFQGHEDRDMSVILMLNVPEQKEYVFEVSDSAGGTAQVAVRIKEGWREYIAQQIQKIDDKLEQGASKLDIYHTAKEIIASSGYKELSAPLQDVFTAQLLEAAKQPEAAAIAYAKAKKESPEIAGRLVANRSPVIKSNLTNVPNKRQYTANPIMYHDRNKIKFANKNTSDSFPCFLNKKTEEILFYCNINYQESRCLDNNFEYLFFIKNEIEVVYCKRICFRHREDGRIRIGIELFASKKQYYISNGKSQYFEIDYTEKYEKNWEKMIENDVVCQETMSRTELPMKITPLNKINHQY
ncbi:MAG: hypothetical protein ACTFAL_12625 [Candidatus Electronema sp. V4]|uniref:hypothetical protein n=1 Tax=Candidatus Electronema sp. V4 TaxID=3454756 RepID=UPI00405547FD